MALGNQSLAGIARVSYEAVGLADFQNDNQAASRSYRSSTEDMSDAAIKLELAQDRLRRAVQKGPSAYREQARAELAVRNSERELRQENERLERQLRDTNNQLGRLSRGAVAGSGLFHGLGRSVAFASAGFLGGAGFVYGVRQAINVASNLDEQLDKTRRVFGQYSTEIERAGKTSAVSVGLANDQWLEYTSTLGALFRPLDIVGQRSAQLSADLVRRGADLASFYNRDVTDALEALRSGIVGEAEPLRTFGVRLSETRVQALALAQTGKENAKQLTDQEKALARISIIMKDSNIAAGNFQDTSDGLANSQRQLAALWRDTQGLLGQAIIPSYKEVVQGLRDWLAEDENREELQRNINTLVRDGAAVTRAFAHAIGEIKDELAPVVDLLGGLDRTIEIALIAGLLYKSRNVLRLGVIPLRLGIALWGPTAVTSAATTVAAENAIGNGALAQIPKVTALRTALAGLSFGAAGATAGAVAAGVVVGAGLVRGLSEVESRFIENASETRKKNAAIIARDWRKYGAKWLKQAYANSSPEMKALIKKALMDRGDQPGLQAIGASMGGSYSPDFVGPIPPGSEIVGGGSPIPKNKPGGPDSAGGFTFESFEAGISALEEAALDAAATASTADDARVARRRLALARRALAELKLTREERIRVKQERNRALSDLAAIEHDEDQAAAQERSERVSRLRNEEARLVNAYEAAKLTERLSDDRKRLRALLAFYREASHNMDLTVAQRRAYVKKRIATQQKIAALNAEDSEAMRKALADAQKYYDRMEKALGNYDLSTRKGLREAALRGIDPKTGKPKGSDGDTFTVEDMRRQQYEFLTGLQGMFNEFGSDLFSSSDFAKMSTNSQLQLHEQRKQTNTIERLVARSRLPAGEYAYRIATSHGDAYAF